MEIGEINIDFFVVESNPKSLIVADNSDWYYAENKPSWIFITNPGSTKEIEFAFKKYSLNSFNSNNLGKTCITSNCKPTYNNLEDGIYTIRLLSNIKDIETTKYYLKTDLLEYKLSKLIVDKGIEYKYSNNLFVNTVFDIKWYLEQAKSFTKEGYFNEAQRYFQEAEDKLNTITNCKNGRTNKCR